VSPFSAAERRRSLLTLVAGVVVTALTLPLVGASGLVGGAVVGYYFRGGYGTNAVLGAGVGIAGTALVVVPLFALTIGRIEVMPELYYVLFNGVFGAIGSVVAVLFRSWRGGDDRTAVAGPAR